MGEIGDNEKIDIITYNEDAVSFITNALSPTSVSEVTIDEASRKALVKVPEDQLSIAIGKSGQNVRLASKLSGYEIDIVSSNGGVQENTSETNEPVEQEAKVAVKPASRPKRKSELEESLLSAIDGQEEDTESEK